MNWPDAPNEFPLGDGRYASAAERPGDREALAEAAGRIAAEGGAIYPQGGRTALEAGGVPGRPGVAIDLTGLNRVVDYPAADMTITVEAGITLAALQGVLAGEGQRLPLEAPHSDRSTIGGIYATDTSGPRRFGLGRPRDQVIGIAFATSKGEVIRGGGRVVKNVAGYDFPKLLTGSMGSLGMIVELTLKTRPRPEVSAIVWASWPSAGPIDAVLAALNTSRSRPVAIELLNRPSAGRVARLAGMELPAGGVVLAVGVEGTSEVVSWQVDALRRELAGASSCEEVRGAEADRLWEALVNHPASGTELAFKANLLPSAIPGFVAGIDPSRWAMQCHSGSGIAWGLAEPGAPIDALVADVLRLREAAIAAEGNLTLPRCPTDRKEELGVWGAPRGDWELARQVKRALDPAGAMNPGRFL